MKLFSDEYVESKLPEKANAQRFARFSIVVAEIEIQKSFQAMGRTIDNKALLPKQITPTVYAKIHSLYDRIKEAKIFLAKQDMLELVKNG